MTEAGARPRVRTIVVLGLLSTFGPLSLDLYLPALPQLADELGASTSAAQLSITACLVGLATGQLVAGPLSDRFGRRRPLLVGLVAYLMASLACGFASTISVLLTLRLVQGLAGAAGLVIAPVLGGQLSKMMSWRGIFVVLAGFGLALLCAGIFGVRETLPADRRTRGGLGTTLHGFVVLLKDRLFVGAALSSGLAGASMFAYIAGATFVLQRIYGLSPVGFSLAFGANSLGIMTAGQIGGRLARGWSAPRVLALGLLVNLVGAAGLAATVVVSLGLPFLLGSLFVMVSAVGLVFPTATALAMADYPNQAGAASSLLGLGQYFAGAVAAPLVGIAGEGSAVPLGLVALGASVCAGAVFSTLVYPAVRARRVLPEPPGGDPGSTLA